MASERPAIATFGHLRRSALGEPVSLGIRDAPIQALRA
jgi:hypothetical protein